MDPDSLDSMNANQTLCILGACFCLTKTLLLAGKAVVEPALTALADLLMIVFRP